MTSAPTYSTRFKIFATALLAVAIAAFVGAYLSVSSSEDDRVLEASGQDAYVEALLPARDGQVPQQTRLGIDLVSGWNGFLTVNDTRIPEDQLRVTPELGLIEFTPGEGQAIEQLPGGRNCITATVWPLAEGPEQGSRTVTWCFQVV